jgi:DNA-binding XRE family transcriptional regulator
MSRATVAPTRLDGEPHAWAEGVLATDRAILLAASIDGAFSMDNERHERLQCKLVRALGPTVLEALNDAAVVEICLNPNTTLWVEHLRQPMAVAGTMPAVEGDAPGQVGFVVASGTRLSCRGQNRRIAARRAAGSVPVRPDRLTTPIIDPWRAMRRRTPPSPSPLLFARHMRRLRQATGMTLEELHEKTGLSKGYLSMVERGKVNISLGSADKIAQTFGVALYAMLVPYDERNG